MAGYSVFVKPSAAREMAAIEPRRLRQRLVDRIGALATEPRPPGCEPLAGAPGCFRIRQGPYRVVYAVDDEAGTVIVVKVGHRREVYR